MKSKLESILQILLNDQELDQVFHERIFEFGKKNKNYQLLAILAKRTDLSISLKAKLNEVNSYLVKISMLSRPGITEEEIAESLKRESRVKVLSSLASSKGLSLSIYDSIYKATDNKKVLFDIVSNKDIDLSVRLNSTIKIIKLLEKAYTGTGIYDTYLQDLSLLSKEIPLVVDKIKGKKSLTLRYGIAKYSELDENDQLTLVSDFAGHITPDLSRATSSYYDNPTNKLHDFVSALLKNGPIYPKSYDLLEPLFEIAKKNTQSYSSKKIADIQLEAERAKPIGLEFYQSFIDSITNSENLDRALESIESKKITNSLPFPEIKLQSLANFVITRPYASDYALTTADSFFRYNTSYLDLVKESTTKDDHMRFCRLYIYLRNLNLDDLLQLAENPDLVITSILEQADKLSHHKIYSLMTSKHFKTEYLNYLPLEILSNIQGNSDFTSFIANQLKNVFENKESWENFEMLIESYTGNLGNLIETSNSI